MLAENIILNLLILLILVIGHYYCFITPCLLIHILPLRHCYCCRFHGHWYYWCHMPPPPLLPLLFAAARWRFCRHIDYAATPFHTHCHITLLRHDWLPLCHCWLWCHYYFSPYWYTPYCWDTPLLRHDIGYTYYYTCFRAIPLPLRCCLAITPLLRWYAAYAAAAAAPLAISW